MVSVITAYCDGHRLACPLYELTFQLTFPIRACVPSLIKALSASAVDRYPIYSLDLVVGVQQLYVRLDDRISIVIAVNLQPMSTVN